MDLEHDAVFLIDGEQLLELSRAPYEIEDDFQKQLAMYPRLLGGAQFPGIPERRWLLVDREVPVPDRSEGSGRWSLDHLFIDQDAIPTLVEVKRASDTRLRREVVGQMLDYAANGPRYWPADLLRGRWESRLPEGQDPADAIQEFAGIDVEEFWTRVSRNLREGRVRMLFVSDSIPTELQTVIEYLNEQMASAEVLGVSMSRYAGQGLSVLVPRVVGSSARIQQTKLPTDTGSYEEHLEEAGPAAQEVEKRLLDFSATNGFPTRRTPKALQLRTPFGDRDLLQFYPAYKLQLTLDPLRGLGYEDTADQLLQQIETISREPVTEKYPGIPFDDALEHWSQIEEIVRRLADPGQARN